MIESSTSEQADWEAVQRRDPAAFARVFDRHRDVVFRQALRLLEQPADAEEVAAAAFFELWRKRDEVAPVAGSLRPWLLVTTTNLARNSRRVRVRRERFLRQLAQHHPLDSGSTAFERVDDDVVRIELASALRKLKPHDAALVTLTALDGYSVSEVAGVLGLSSGAARVRLSRAHARLRGLLPPDTVRRTSPQEVVR